MFLTTEEAREMRLGLEARSRMSGPDTETSEICQRILSKMEALMREWSVAGKQGYFTAEGDASDES